MKKRTHAPRTTHTAAPAPAPPDVEAQAIMARAKRIAACEREVWAALAPILERHRCRLGTVQQIVDGQAGPTKIVVFASD